MIARSGSWTIAVESVAVGVLLAPPPDALAVFTSGVPAFHATFTVSKIAAPVPPAPITSLLVQLIDCPDPLHVHPVPVAETYVRPAGSVSVAVIVPDVATFPELPTVIVYVPADPWVKPLLWLFVIVRFCTAPLA